MRFDILTLFPEMFLPVLSKSIIGRAVEKEIIEIHTTNIRDFSKSKHKKVDDYPYGGGAGMVMQPQPIYDAYQHIQSKREKPHRVIYLSPQGKTFNHQMALDLAKEEQIVFLCGHYEGIDQRVIDEIVTDEVSIGDFVLTGGELPTMLMIDAISRLIPGVLSSNVSFEDESFYNGLLEYPQYTRPPEFLGKQVPEVLLSGNHKNIDKWRREQSLLRTLNRRPDLFQKAELTEQDKKFLKEQTSNCL